jgi:prepilin-type N-terminal cleavage/methylation domain-containing protein
MSTGNEAKAAEEAGFSLVELLVAISVLAIIGGAILSVIVSTSEAERTAADIRDKLDTTRIAVERVSRELRGADEVCADADSTQLRFWSDDDTDDQIDSSDTDGDGALDSGEGITYDVDDSGTSRVLRRREFADDWQGSWRNVAFQLADPSETGVPPYFSYNQSPDQQPPAIICGSPSSPGSSWTSAVSMKFTIDTGDAPDNANDLTAETRVRLRNANG